MDRFARLPHMDWLADTVSLNWHRIWPSLWLGTLGGECTQALRTSDSLLQILAKEEREWICDLEDMLHTHPFKKRLLISKLLLTKLCAVPWGQEEENLDHQLPSRNSGAFKGKRPDRQMTTLAPTKFSDWAVPWMLCLGGRRGRPLALGLWKWGRMGGKEI